LISISGNDIRCDGGQAVATKSSSKNRGFGLVAFLCAGLFRRSDFSQITIDGLAECQSFGWRAVLKVPALHLVFSASGPGFGISLGSPGLGFGWPAGLSDDRFPRSEEHT